MERDLKADFILLGHKLSIELGGAVFAGTLPPALLHNTSRRGKRLIEMIRASRKTRGRSAILIPGECI
jgi:hypothetical protein